MIGVIDSGLGNVASVRNMLKSIGVDAISITDPKDLARASKLILPGIGAFNEGVRRLQEFGFHEEIRRANQQRGVPLLGICLGMQLLLEHSEEGKGEGLGLVPGRVRKFRFKNPEHRLPVPNMGWRGVRWLAPVGRLADPAAHEGDRFYFVHSFHAEPADPGDVLAYATYGYEYCCAVRRGNVTGVQFHPEKSHRFGKQLLRDWCSDD